MKRKHLLLGLAVAACALSIHLIAEIRDERDKLLADDGAGGHWLGRSVAISGSRCILGTQV